MNNNIGYEKGDICNRNGCCGIIEEHDTDTSCSCHINPPCGHCVDSREYCPVCEWEGRDDQREAGKLTPEQSAYYTAQNAKWEAERKTFYDLYHSNKPATELNMRSEMHTHFSMIWLGYFPPNTETRDSLLSHFKSYWGGRWEQFNPEIGRFKYILYTD